MIPSAATSTPTGSSRWPEYAQAIEDEANGPDMTAEEEHGV